VIFHVYVTGGISILFIQMKTPEKLVFLSLIGTR